MNAPSDSLLQRSRQPGEQAAWERLVDLYTPLLYFWACRAGLQGPEAADLVRAVFAAVGQKLPELPPGSTGFRLWLRALAVGQRRELLQKRALHVGKPGTPAAEPPPIPAAADAMWEAEYLPFLLGRAVELLQGEFAAAEWKAWQALTVDGWPAAEVARELNLSLTAVYTAEAHVMRRLRRELDGLLD
jgi:RNA polymerase sigma-70 factor (ECF subfamily)